MSITTSDLLSKRPAQPVRDYNKFLAVIVDNSGSMTGRGMRVADYIDAHRPGYVFSAGAEVQTVRHPGFFEGDRTRHLTYSDSWERLGTALWKVLRGVLYVDEIHVLTDGVCTVGIERLKFDDACRRAKVMGVRVKVVLMDGQISQ